MNERLSRLNAKQEEARKAREALVEKRAAIVQVAEDEGREDLTETEDTEFRDLTTKIAELDDEIKGRDERVAELSEEETREQASVAAFRRAQIAETRVRVTSEARAYEKGDNRRSYFADLYRAQMNGDAEARGRLDRHAMEVQTDPAFAEHRDLNRTDTTGGYFVPPLWLMQDFEALARAGRVTANLVTNMPLPPGTDSINVPKINTGTVTAIQTGDNEAVDETDLADTVVTCGVKTIAGQQDVAVQLLEQSPLSFDQVIFADLTADYATKLNLQVLSGADASGEVEGIRLADGVNTVTYTDTAPTLPELYAKLADGIQKIHTNRFLPPTAIIMHPRRWAWALSAVDTTNRPLIVPAVNGPQNAAGSFAGVVSEGLVGSIQGVNVYADPSIPTTLGASTNEDTIIIMRTSDSVLYESGIRTRVFPSVGSGTLTVRLQVYGYLAFTAERQPKSITLVTGSGLTVPTF